MKIFNNCKEYKNGNCTKQKCTFMLAVIEHDPYPMREGPGHNRQGDYNTGC